MGGCMGTRDVPAADLSLEQSMERIESRFRKIDKNGDGVVNNKEFGEMLPALGLNWDKDKVEKTMIAIDTNGDGVLDLREFKAACYMACLRSPDAKIDDILKIVLDRMTKKGPMDKVFLSSGIREDGRSAVPLKSVETRSGGLIAESIESRIEQVFVELDKDMDGLIDFNEFVGAIKSLELNWSNQKIKNVLLKIGGKNINFNQFKLCLMAAAVSNPESNIKDIFKTTLINLSTKSAMNAGFRENKVKNMLKNVNKEFDKIDANKDGKLDLAEFTAAVKEFNLDWDDAKIKDALVKIDTDKSGTIERLEFTTVFYAACVSNPEGDIKDTITAALEKMVKQGAMRQQFAKGIPDLNKVMEPQVKMVFEDDVATRIQQKFFEIDIDRDGAINANEFAKAIKDLGIDWQEATVKKIMKEISGNGDEIAFSQFRAVLDSACVANPTSEVSDILKITLVNMKNKALMNKQFNNEEVKNKTNQLAEEFKKRDKDGNGTLDFQEFVAACNEWGVEASDDALKKMLNRIDTDRSGDIDLTEFRRAFSLAVSKNPTLDMKEAIRVTLESMANRGGMNAAFKSMGNNFNLKQRKTRQRSPEEDVVSKIATKFQEMDRDGDGALSIKEFAEGIQKLGLKWPDYKIRGVMKKIDKDGSGDISFSELTQVLYAAIEAFPTKSVDSILGSTLQHYAEKSSMNDQFREVKQKKILEDVEKKFQKIDKNNDGQLDQAEFQAMVMELGLGWSEEETAKALKEIDADKSGTISKIEFRTALYMACMRNSDTGIDAILEVVLKRMQNQGAMNSQLGNDWPELKKTKKREKSKYEEDSLSKIEQAFFMVDINRDGVLSASELSQTTQKLGLNWDQAKCEQVLKEIDIDGTGQLNMFDFSHVVSAAATKNPKGTVEDILKDSLENMARQRAMKAQMRAQSLKNKVKAMEAKFKELDKDSDGKLDLGEFTEAVKSFNLAWSQEEVKDCLDKIDTDKSGTIERLEFNTAFTSACMKNPDLPINEIIVAALNQMMNKGNLNQSFAMDFTKVVGGLKKTKTRAQGPITKEDVLTQIEQKFMEMDVDMDGKITQDEMAKALKSMGLLWDEDKISGLMKKMSKGRTSNDLKFADFKPAMFQTAVRHPKWTIDQVLRTAITNISSQSGVNSAIRSRSPSAASPKGADEQGKEL